jgi:Nuclease-related domain
VLHSAPPFRNAGDIMRKALVWSGLALWVFLVTDASFRVALGPSAQKAAGLLLNVGFVALYLAGRRFIALPLLILVSAIFPLLGGTDYLAMLAPGMLIALSLVLVFRFHMADRHVLRRFHSGQIAELLVRFSLALYVRVARGQCHAMHNVFVPRNGKWVEVDHVLILPELTIAFETKGFKHRMSVDQNGHWYRNGRLLEKNPRDQLLSHVRAVAQIETNVPVCGVLVFPRARADGLFDDGVVFGWFFRLHRAIRRLRRDAALRAQPELQRALPAVRLQRFFAVCRFDAATKQEHSQQLWQRHHETDASKEHPAVERKKLRRAYIVAVSSFISLFAVATMASHDMRTMRPPATTAKSAPQRTPPAQDKKISSGKPATSRILEKQRIDVARPTRANGMPANQRYADRDKSLVSAP